jgi:hypothetical protein
MLRGAKDYFSPLVDPVNKLRKYLSDRALITDLTAKLVITFGVVLMIGGLYLMITDPGASNQAAQSMVSTVGWVPGIPFYIGNIASSSASTAGLVAWLVGLDLLLVGLGLWVRHKLARFTTVLIFGLSACFQFIKFLYVGVMGAPAAFAQVCIDAVLIYFLISKFDSPTGIKKQLIS